MISFLTKIVVVVGIISGLLVQQPYVAAKKRIQYTPNCLCPSEDKFPPPNAHGITLATWCGYDLGPECDIQRGYLCYLNMTNKLARFQSMNCLGGREYCIPLDINPKFKACGSLMECETIRSCKNSLNATEIALQNLRKTYGQNSTKYRWPGS
jgi:hypothetical protein